MAGHSAVSLVRLDGAEERRLLDGVFRAGSRSVLFRFPDIVEDGVGDMLGAIIESVESAAEGLLRVELWFWNDLATIYVTPGSRFEVWYAGTVGEGLVLPGSAGGAEGGADSGVGE